MEIDHHFWNLLFIRQMHIVSNLLRHFRDNNIADIIILELIVLMTGFSLLAVPDAPVDDPVLVPLVVELEGLLPEPLLPQDQTVLVPVRVEVDDPKATVDFDYLTPVRSPTRLVKFDRFKLEGETVLLHEFVTSCFLLS